MEPSHETRIAVLETEVRMLNDGQKELKSLIETLRGDIGDLKISVAKLVAIGGTGLAIAQFLIQHYVGG